MPPVLLGADLLDGVEAAMPLPAVASLARQPPKSPPDRGMEGTRGSGGRLALAAGGRPHTDGNSPRGVAGVRGDRVTTGINPVNRETLPRASRGWPGAGLGPPDGGGAIAR